MGQQEDFEQNEVVEETEDFSDEILGMLGEGTPTLPDESAAAEPVGDSGSAEAPGEDEEAGADAPDEDAGSGVEQSAIEEPTDEVTALRAQLKEMAAQMNYLRAAAEQAQTQAVAQEDPLEDMEFLTEESFGDFLTDPKMANRLLNEVRRQGIAKGREIMMREMPSLIRPHVEEAIGRRMVVRDFYDQNKDLRGHADYVGFVSQKLAQGAGDVNPAEFMRLVAAEARKGLGLPADGSGGNPENIPLPKPKAKAKPGFANPGGARRPPQQKVDSMAQEISNMLSNR